MGRFIIGEDVSVNNPPLEKLLEINSYLDDLENERMAVIADAIITEREKVIRDWSVDDIQQDMAAIQIYYKNIFVELRYHVPTGDATNEYISVETYEKGVIEPILLCKNKVEVMEEFFLPRLFEAIDRGIQYCINQGIIKED